MEELKQFEEEMDNIVRELKEMEEIKNKKFTRLLEIQGVIKFLKEKKEIQKNGT
jgi:hypothetical protein